MPSLSLEGDLLSAPVLGRFLWGQVPLSPENIFLPLGTHPVSSHATPALWLWNLLL